MEKCVIESIVSIRILTLIIFLLFFTDVDLSKCKLKLSAF